MLGGDISNEMAPTLVIDIDGLILTEKKVAFGLATEWTLNSKAIKILDHHMSRGRMIYLLVHGRNARQFKDIEEFLDSYDFPYTKLYHIEDPQRREAILGRNHIHFYYYLEKLHAATDNKRKEKQIFNIAELYF